MLPPKERMCHRCNFEKSCRDLVTSEACGRWGKLSCTNEHGEPADTYMCVDDMNVALNLHSGRLINQVIGSLDALRVENQKNSDRQATLNTALAQLTAEGNAKLNYALEQMGAQPLTLIDSRTREN
jgi:hypothetical protein